MGRSDAKALMSTLFGQNYLKIELGGPKMMEHKHHEGSQRAFVALKGLPKGAQRSMTDIGGIATGLCLGGLGLP